MTNLSIIETEKINVFILVQLSEDRDIYPIKLNIGAKTRGHKVSTLIATRAKQLSIDKKGGEMDSIVYPTSY